MCDSDLDGCLDSEKNNFRDTPVQGEVKKLLNICSSVLEKKKYFFCDRNMRHGTLLPSRHDLISRKNIFFHFFCIRNLRHGIYLPRCHDKINGNLIDILICITTINVPLTTIIVSVFVYVENAQKKQKFLFKIWRSLIKRILTFIKWKKWRSSHIIFLLKDLNTKASEIHVYIGLH